MLESSVSSSFSEDPLSSYQPAVGGSVQNLSLDGQSVKISIDDISSDVVIALYSSAAGSEQNSFQISSFNGGGGIKGLKSAMGDDVDQVEKIEGEELDITESVHGVLRELESEIEGETPTKKSALYATKALDIGGTREFKVIDSFSTNNGYTKVTARLRYQNEQFDFYVDVRDEKSISDESLEILGDNFENTLDAEREFFGEESDVDGDGRFAVLFTQEVNKLGSKMGGVITGYFYAMDLFDTSKYPSSNEMEILYTFVPDPKGEYGSSLSESFAVHNVIKGVLPHEFQHMISFNQHYFINSSVVEKGWLNESISHLAEDLYTLGSNDMMNGFGLENPARVASYLSDISNICFTCGTNLSERGGGYLFMKYLYEQAELGNLPVPKSGAEFLNDLLNTPDTGTENIVSAVYGPGSSEENFKELLGNFSLAVYLSNTNQTGDDKYGFMGIDLRGLVKDNRGTYLDGPSVQVISGFPYTDSLKGHGITYVQITAELLQQTGGQLVFSANSGADFGAYVIQ